MKIVFSILMVLLLVSCSSSKTAKKTNPYPTPSARKASGTSTASSTSSMPPGQAKKVYGHQSAKAFAPGQRKKKTRG